MPYAPAYLFIIRLQLVSYHILFYFICILVKKSVYSSLNALFTRCAERDEQPLLKKESKHTVLLKQAFSKFTVVTLLVFQLLRDNVMEILNHEKIITLIFNETSAVLAIIILAVRTNLSLGDLVQIL